MADTIPEPLTSAKLRTLKSRGQLLEPTLFVGKAGLSDAFQRQLEDELEVKELVKVKFVAFKEEKKTLARQMAGEARSHLVMRVGNVAVLYRQHPDPARRRFDK